MDMIDVIIKVTYNHQSQPSPCVLVAFYSAGLVSCCKWVAFFGIIFYFTMGFIVLGQVQFLKFQPDNQSSTVISCFITMFLEVAIFVALLLYQNKQESLNVNRQNYVDMNSQRDARARESSFKGIALTNIQTIRQEKISEEQPKFEELL